MPTNTGGGTTTSFMNTPQATDDTYVALEDGIYSFDVMADDLGGNAKTLWSVDDANMDGTTTLNADGTATSTTAGNGVLDLTVQDVAGVKEKSALGASIWIENGKIKYDTSSLDWLAAGQSATDTFTYAIRLSNGTLSWATVTVKLTGSNDGPTITSAAQSGHVTEDVAGASVAGGTIAFNDVDLSDNHTASFVQTAGETHLGAFSLAQVSEGTNAAGGSVAWSYTIDEAAAQYLAAGETVTEHYVVTVDDGNGGTVAQTVTVTITGTNDAPTIAVAGTDAIGAVTEDAMTPMLGDTGTIAFNDVDLIDGHSASVTAAAGNTLGGTLVMGTASEDPGTQAGTIGWTYSVANSAVQYLAQGETATETFTVAISDGHGGTVSQDVTVTVTGTNDAPTIAVAGTDALGAVTEDATSPTLGDSGTIAFNDVDLIDVHSASVTAAAGNSLGGTLVMGTASEDAGTEAGAVGWTYSVANSAVQYLAKGETATETFTVAISDGHGGSVSQDVIVTIMGTNDAPTIAIAGTDALGAVTEDSAAPTLGDTGTIAFNDVDLIDVHSASVAAAAGNTLGGTLTMGTASEDAGTEAGAIGWTYSVDNSAVQYLGAGETAAETFTVSISDGHGGSVSQDVVVTVTGTNDDPTIEATAQAGSVTEDSLPTGASGSFAFADVDLSDVHSVSATAHDSGYLGTFTPTVSNDSTGGGAGQINWDFSVDNAAIQYLGANDTLTQIYTIIVDDGHGGTAAQNVTVTITGTNDVPVIAGVSTGAVSEDVAVTDGQLTTSGLLTIADVDQGQSSFAPQGSVAGAYGTFTLAADGSWTYSADDSQAAIQQLGAERVDHRQLHRRLVRWQRQPARHRHDPRHQRRPDHRRSRNRPVRCGHRGFRRAIPHRQRHDHVRRCRSDRRSRGVDRLGFREHARRNARHRRCRRGSDHEWRNVRLDLLARERLRAISRGRRDGDREVRGHHFRWARRYGRAAGRDHRHRHQ